MNLRHRELGVVPVADRADQAFEIEISLEDLLSAQDRLALKNGEKVKANVIFFTRSFVSVIYPDGREVEIGIRASGAYSVSFALQLDGDRHLNLSEIVLRQ